MRRGTQRVPEAAISESDYPLEALRRLIKTEKRLSALQTSRDSDSTDSVLEDRWGCSIKDTLRKRRTYEGKSENRLL